MYIWKGPGLFKIDGKLINPGDNIPPGAAGPELLESMIKAGKVIAVEIKTEIEKSEPEDKQKKTRKPRGKK